MDKNEFEFSSLVTIESIPADRDVAKTIEATPDECINLAKRLEIAELSGLKAEIVLFRSSKSNILTVKGDIEAKIGQKCVISLQNIDSDVKIDFETSFSNGKEIIEGENLEDDDLEDDCNSPISDGNIDIGELVTQYLSLEIDPYPRVEDAKSASEPAPVEENPSADTHNPFAGLKDMMDKD